MLVDECVECHGRFNARPGDKLAICPRCSNPPLKPNPSREKSILAREIQIELEANDARPDGPSPDLAANIAARLYELGYRKQ